MLKGKTAVVTGGSRGIGEAIVYKLASMGANVAVIYAGSRAAAERVCEKCKQEYSVEAKAYQCNVADFSAAKETVAKIKTEFGTAQILINNAGITRDGLLVRMSEENYDLVVAVNQKSVFNMTKLAGSVMMKQRSGRIINLASVAGLYGNPGQMNYSATKAAIIGMTKTTAKELGPRNITCNAVAPGFIHTAMTDALSEELRAAMVKQIAMGRCGEVEEIAGVVSFLASKDASYVTGQVIEISGGLSM